jgi:hypothetical protein
VRGPIDRHRIDERFGIAPSSDESRAALIVNARTPRAYV